MRARRHHFNSFSVSAPPPLKPVFYWLYLQNMRGKVACVTGANSGIGYCVAKSLAERNCTVHMVCRNKERGEDARNRALSATGNEDVHLHVVDVSDFRQVIIMFLTFVLRSLACFVVQAESTTTCAGLGIAHRFCRFSLHLARSAAGGPEV